MKPRIIRWPRRHDNSGEAPRHNRGCRFECTRCGNWSRIPTSMLYELSTPALCGACIMDDIAEARLRRPRAHMFARVGHEMRRWTDGD